MVAYHQCPSQAVNRTELNRNIVDTTQVYFILSLDIDFLLSLGIMLVFPSKVTSNILHYYYCRQQDSLR